MELKRGCSQIFLSLCSLERSFTICQCHSTFARLKSKQAGTFHNTSTDAWSLLSYIHLCKLSKILFKRCNSDGKTFDICLLETEALFATDYGCFKWNPFCLSNRKSSAWYAWRLTHDNILITGWQLLQASEWYYVLKPCWDTRTEQMGTFPLVKA